MVRHASTKADTVKLDDKYGFISALATLTKVAASITVIAGLSTGVCQFMGWKMPPWVTTAEAQQMQSVQQQTVQALGQLTGTVNKLANRLDRKDCEEFNAQYWRAYDALVRRPDDPIARDSLKAARDKIQDTSGCTIDVRR